MICQRIRVSGVVQGVGFRPFVWRLARELDLAGWVRNDAQGVEIEARGAAERVRSLVERLQRDAPPLARVDKVVAKTAAAARKTQHESRHDSPEEGFVIISSRGGRATTMIGHDTAVCRDCLAEMFDPPSRRARYAFTHCTHCGPRYTISRSLPYDRAKTSLKPFALCAKCLAEYRQPDDRRFHAEANCCPKCGPQLALLDAEGCAQPGDPVALALGLLRRGKVLAIKGLGGFHLVCDARNAAAVAVLRERKQREEKPFAVMMANAASAASFVQMGVGEPGLLNLPERPAILLRKRGLCDEELPGVAPGLAWLGVMLPTTPLQYLLFHEAAGRPAGTHWLERGQELALVMTSANPGGEPLVTGNAEALLRLSGIADAYLVHDREILVRCDDSVARAAPGGVQFIRRARGYAPRAIKLPHCGPPALAVGGWFKNTICVTRGDEAFVSQHIGDLDNAAACGFFEESVAHLLKLLEVEPAIVAHDLHPDFHSTRFAADFARRHDLPLLGVQHHHAHAAAVLAEHGVEEGAIALALDGVGLGDDGAAWGGEMLRLDGANFERLGHLAPIRLPGGDRAAREPWRMAASVLHELGRGGEIAARFAGQPAAPAVAQMLASDLNCPPTSSLGRLFDAAAGLLGIKPVMAFEGQSAMLLEGLAERYGDVLPIEHGWKIDKGCLDLLPLLAALADEKDAGRGAAIFHATLIAALADWVHAAVPADSTVAGSGGCFLNQIVARGLRSRLGACGLHLLEARRLPPNDGGLSLGQAWVAWQHLAQPKEP
ncbi:MAG: carbamoyltransferase HypF [Betaproteobacteria bacterium]|nr:carbamoyltransferase HypF [Betaproteobacteria bacterium]